MRSPSASKTLVGILVLLTLSLCAIEIGTRRVALNMSRIERRVKVEYDDALRVRRVPGHSTALVVGNSLLDADVDFPALKASLAPQVDAHRLVVEQTAFYDWYYGLTSLLAKGVHPDVMVLMLDRTQYLTDGVRGGYTAYRMMRPADVPKLAHDVHLHPTVASGYMLASVSAFYGLRADIRKVFLGKLLPPMQSLAPLFAPRRPNLPIGPSAYPIALERFQRLKALTDSYQIPLVLVFPPQTAAMAVPAAEDQVLRAAHDAGIPVFATTMPEAYPISAFQDGFHLNPGGAARFTAELAPALSRKLTQLRASLE